MVLKRVILSPFLQLMIKVTFTYKILLFISGNIVNVIPPLKMTYILVHIFQITKLFLSSRRSYNKQTGFVKGPRAVVRFNYQSIGAEFRLSFNKNPGVLGKSKFLNVNEL